MWIRGARGRGKERFRKSETIRKVIQSEQSGAADVTRALTAELRVTSQALK